MAAVLQFLDGRTVATQRTRSLVDIQSPWGAARPRRQRLPHPWGQLGLQPQGPHRQGLQQILTLRREMTPPSPESLNHLRHTVHYTETSLASWDLLPFICISSRASHWASKLPMQLMLDIGACRGDAVPGIDHKVPDRCWKMTRF